MTCNFCKDACYWRITYADGEVVTECIDNEHDHRSFREVDASRVRFMEWVDVEDQTSRLGIELLADVQRPMLCRRRFLTFSVDSMQEVGPRTTVHILGVENEQYYFLLPSGQIINSPDLNAI